jgi:GTPase SAR1 family protein
MTDLTKKGNKISSTEMKDEEFFKQKADLKIILIGDSAVGKSK